MEYLNIEYSEEDLRHLMDIFKLDSKRNLRGNNDKERTEALRSVLADSSVGSLYWAAFSVRIEDIAKHIHLENDEDAKQVLRWRLEIGK